MKKKYLIKVDKNLIKKLKPFWEMAKNAEDKYYKEIDRIEKQMKKSLEINAELFRCDGAMVGIGNYERTMRLIHANELEK